MSLTPCQSFQPPIPSDVSWVVSMSEKFCRRKTTGSLILTCNEKWVYMVVELDRLTTSLQCLLVEMFIAGDDI